MLAFLHPLMEKLVIVGLWYLGNGVLVVLNRETWEEYAREVELLAHKLLGLICLSLGLPGADGLKGYFQDEQMSLVRMNRYPPCPSPDLVLGVGRHKDAGALTILAQDGVGGLQVKSKSDGEWIPVKPIPNAYIVNVGDVVQVCFFILLYTLLILYIIYTCIDSSSAMVI